ncbi:type VI secretion system Vgr family protein [Polyangium sorediatum]|uniref:Type VI secretion system tip protein TssI/VgrG n=1 Tax=Polyangium sorediatum TaxID=889274 RepID=A0ABT6NPB0_9BACT|nr:type VI secretion system tip protein TssI/VgrG [Polyangium sorediatum]MDI1430154.1 type VI secretion system tip protein TssI/VgrG [Polyangium sorediatum]
MSVLELSFASGESSLSVRRFSVHEELSSLFSISVWARSPHEDLDTDAIVGKPASLRVVSGTQFLLSGARLWSGICNHMEQVQAEPSGLSTYYLRIVPRLWLLTQRRNHRIFQRKSVPDIVDAVLGEWQIEPTWKVDRAAYPKLDYRVQYGESDYAFITRLLEDAGITFGFEDDEEKGSRLVLWDAPQRNEPRSMPIKYVDKPNEASEFEFVTGVRLSDVVRPGRFTVRDHDFRRQPQFKLLGETPTQGTAEDPLEQYEFGPGSFSIIQPGADTHGKAAKQSAGAAGGEGQKSNGLLGDWRNKVDDVVDDKVTQLVNEQVVGLLNKALKDVAGQLTADVAGDILGGLAGEVAGNVAGKLASDIVGGDRDSLDLDLEKILREKMKGVVDKRLGGFVDEKVTKFVTKKLGKLGGKLAEKAGDLAGDAAKEVTTAVGGKILDALLGDNEKKNGNGGGDKLAKQLGPGAPVAGLLLAGDDKGAVRHDDKEGKARAARTLESMRTGKRSLGFETNAIDLRPGTVFAILGHPRTDLGPTKRLLVVAFSVEGTHDGEWSMSGHAVFAEQPYRPIKKTPKPRIDGLQSAIVVGPQGQEIHTDEFARVRVQFHWDREGAFDDESSMWMRVSQGWAGPGYGMIGIPRVGAEVLVAFLEGDPDNPVVVGRLFNTTSPVPHKLPDNKTVTAWRSDSSPGGGGFNEILFDDQKGKELVYVQAEKNLRKLVKSDETEITQANRRMTVGGNLTTLVMFEETHTTGADKTVTVGENLRQAIGQNHAIAVGGSMTQNVGQGMSMTVGPNPTAEGRGVEEPSEDVPAGVMRIEVKERLEITVGEAKLVMDKSGRVEINGLEFDFSASGAVALNGCVIDLN